MKTVKIKSITLNNYRCFNGEREFHADFGEKTRVSGKNGSGKSTVMNAVMEVLTGKNADGTQADNVRPIVDGQEVEGVDVERTVVLDIGGKEIEIKKITKQKRERVDGEMQYVPGSNVNSYSVDGISFNQKKLDEFISENICPPETLLACCNPNAFLSLKSTTDMRAFLEKMAGFDLNEYIKSLGAEFSEVDEITKGHPIEQVQKTLNKQLTDQKKATTKAETEWKYEKAKAVDSGEDDITRLTEQKVSYENQIATLDEQEKSLDDVMAAYDQKSKDILDLKFEQSEVVRKANEGLVQQRKELDNEIFSLEQDKKSAENDLRMAEMDLRHANMGIERHTADVKKAQEDWKKCNEKEFADNQLKAIQEEEFDKDSLICPTCGQKFPPEREIAIRTDFEKKKAERIRIAEAEKVAFEEYKDKELARIAESGNKAATDLKEAKKAQAEAERKIAELKQKITSLAMEIQKKQAELSKLPESVDMSDNEEYQKISAKIERAEAILHEMSNGSDLRREITDKRNGFIRECAKIDAEINNIQRKKQAHEEDVEKLYQVFRESSQKEADILRKRDILRNFSIQKNARIAELVNPNFTQFQFVFTDETQSGEIIETCKLMKNGIEYKNLNYSDQLLCRIDLVCGFQKIKGLSLPIFADNAESINSERLPEIEQQMIVLEVSDGDLKVECIDEYMANLDRSYEQLSKNQTISFSLDELRDMESDDWKPTQKIKDFMERMNNE